MEGDLTPVLDVEPQFPTWKKDYDPILADRDLFGPRTRGLRHAAKSAIRKSLRLGPTSPYGDDEYSFRSAFASEYRSLRYKAHVRTHVSFERREHIRDQLSRPGRGLNKWTKKVRLALHRDVMDTPNSDRAAATIVPPLPLIERTPPVNPDASIENEPETACELKTDTASEVKHQATSEVELGATFEDKSDVASEAESDAASEVKPDATSEDKFDEESEAEPDAASEVDPDAASEVESDAALTSPGMRRPSPPITEEETPDEQTELLEGLEKITISPQAGSAHPYFTSAGEGLGSWNVGQRNGGVGEIPNHQGPSSPERSGVSQILDIQGPSKSGRSVQGVRQTGKKRKISHFNGGKSIVCLVWADDPRLAPEACHGYSHIETKRMKNDHLVRFHGFTGLAEVTTTANGRSLSELEMFNNLYSSTYPGRPLPLSPFFCDRDFVIQQRDTEAGREPQSSEISRDLPALLAQIAPLVQSLGVAPNVQSSGIQPSIEPSNGLEQQVRLLQDHVARLDAILAQQLQNGTALQSSSQGLERQALAADTLSANQPQQYPAIHHQQPSVQADTRYSGNQFDIPQFPPAVMSNAVQNAPTYPGSASGLMYLPIPGMDDKPEGSVDDSGLGKDTIYCSADGCEESVVSWGENCSLHREDFWHMLSL